MNDYLVEESKNTNQARVYKVNAGDIFSISIENFSKNPSLWNSPEFKILKIHQIRPRWFFYVFNWRFDIPKPYRIWVIQLMKT